jgi:cytochrome c oxidase subunit II
MDVRPHASRVPPRWFHHKAWTKAAAGLILAAALSGCGVSPTFLNPVSSIASDEAGLYMVIFYLALGVFVIVEVLLAYALIRFRRRAGDTNEPKQVYGNSRLEVVWTAIPVLLVLTLFILTVSTASAVAAPPAAASDVHIHVIGHQWWWEFEYPDYGFTTANELHVPVGTNVKIDLDSVDVIHSFWVPQMAGKTDAIPGHTNQLWIRGDTIGTYHGQCVEFCGANHANMRIKAVVESQADFQAWVKDQQAPPYAPQTPQEQAGRDYLVTQICSNCHTLGDNLAAHMRPEGADSKAPVTNTDPMLAGGIVGPNLTHLMSRSVFAGATYELNPITVRRWLRDTQAMKPGNDMLVNVSPEDIDNLVAYLSKLK